MAVARVELMVAEIDWVVATLEAAGPPPRDSRRALRELKRQQARAHESADREAAADRKRRSMYPTDAANACPECFGASGMHSADCPITNAEETPA
jgi:hypothetical protein